MTFVLTSLVFACCIAGAWIFFFFAEQEISAKQIVSLALSLGIPIGIVTINTVGVVHSALVVGAALISLSLIAMLVSPDRRETRIGLASVSTVAGALIALSFI